MSEKKQDNKFNIGKMFNPLVDGTNKALEKTTKAVMPTAATPKTNDKKKENANKQSIDEVVDQFSESIAEKWDNFCDKLEASDNDTIKLITQKILRRLSVEAPVIVGFTFVCVFLHLLNMTIFRGISVFLGVDSHFSPFSPMQYVRLFTHIAGHDGLVHLRNNMTNMLLVGPSAEAGFGSKAILQVMGVVAITTAFAHMLVGKRNSRQLGASGFVFALILLNSLCSARSGKIPVSFVLTALLWLVDEFVWLFFGKDNTSHHAHLVGGIVGAIAGFVIHERDESERLRKAAMKWKAATKKD
jgi:membrane associated rhomboid family serine protease